MAAKGEVPEELASIREQLVELDARAARAGAAQADGQGEAGVMEAHPPRHLLRSSSG